LIRAAAPIASKLLPRPTNQSIDFSVERPDPAAKRLRIVPARRCRFLKLSFESLRR
jgi:hypothetical protein